MRLLKTRRDRSLLGLLARTRRDQNKTKKDPNKTVETAIRPKEDSSFKTKREKN
jgi:hypothetical protein